MIFDQPTDKFADIFTLTEFKQALQSGLFIPDDGCGYFGTETHFSFDFEIWEMLEKLKTRPEGATHVHWYNK